VIHKKPPTSQGPQTTASSDSDYFPGFPRFRISAPANDHYYLTSGFPPHSPLKTAGRTDLYLYKEQMAPGNQTCNCLNCIVPGFLPLRVLSDVIYQCLIIDPSLSGTALTDTPLAGTLMTLAVRSSLLGDDRRILMNDFLIIIQVVMKVNYFGLGAWVRTKIHTFRGYCPTRLDDSQSWISRIDSNYHINLQRVASYPLDDTRLLAESYDTDSYTL
jgi:hypothetical protein